MTLRRCSRFADVGGYLTGHATASSSQPRKTGLQGAPRERLEQGPLGRFTAG